MEVKDERGIADVIIVPHTHWDREWYKPFQYFRANLVKLIDKLIEINSKQDYYFMLDGQTIVLEDYFEIRPEKKKELLELIRKSKIDVGPWYLLPDEWLVGAESLIRNLEVSYDLAKKFDIPLMNIAYLPDQFGHTRAIPELLSDLTDLSSVVIWRGVGKEVNTVPFNWKSHKNAVKSILGIYMPYGYGNAAHLSDTEEELKEQIESLVEDLKPYSPFEYYLLMNGTDHQFPKEKIAILIKEMDFGSMKVSLGSLDYFVKRIREAIKQENYSLPVYAGEFRSSARAPLLQDTYSARMWIKQWNQKIEDLLVNYAEPINAYLSLYYSIDYPSSYLELSWKWLLKNQPHDSICGCSVDQTHEEMKSRFYWAESIAETTINSAIEKLEDDSSLDDAKEIIVFNPTNSAQPSYFEFSVSNKIKVKSLTDEQGKEYAIQSLSSVQEVIFEDTMKPLMLKSGLKLLPGRKLIDDYINEVLILENEGNDTCEIKIICAKSPIGDLDVKQMKNSIRELIDSGKYKRFHIIATRGTKQTYAAIAPLKPWAFTKFKLNTENTVDEQETEELISTKNSVSNKYYSLKFNSDGTFDLFDKQTETLFKGLHQFEDLGDRGDEYTFGYLGPARTKLAKVKRKLVTNGELFSVIEQTAVFKTFKELNDKRSQRVGKAQIEITTRFKFYRDLPRIDIETQLTNTVKDHRLRICFNLP
ncbi:MAG: hypothetical protein ACTSQE_12880, partial [Candidatus Heimdallarchaeaceae archaeon]